MLIPSELIPAGSPHPVTVAQLHIQSLRADERERRRLKQRRARSRRRGQRNR